MEGAMFEHIVGAYRQFIRFANARVHRKRFTFLEVTTLEERATPAADLLMAIDPPPIILVAEFAPAPVAPATTVAAPIVRLDLIGAVDDTQPDDSLDVDAWLDDLDGKDVMVPPADSHGEPAPATVNSDTDTEPLVVTDDELVHIKLIEELRKIDA
jgi:hypothetical protein